MTTLVLLPGMDGSGELFAPLIAALNSEFKTVVVRYPPNEALNYAELESIARALLPANEPFFVLGESFSGPIAVSIAASAPPGLKGLILCASFARNPQPMFSGFERIIQFLPVKNRLSLAVLRRVLLGRFSSDNLRRSLAHAIKSVSSAVLHGRLREVLLIDVSSKLAQVKVPMLYLQAARDRAVPPASREHICQIAPHCKVAVINAPHFLLQAAPAQAAGAIEEFMRGK